MASFTPGQILFAAQLLAALGEKSDLTLLGAANGVATLGADGKLLSSQLPALSITDVFVIASEAAMLALTAQRGDVAVRSDLSKTFILAVEGAATLANWQEVLVPAGGGVSSVAGRTGSIVLTADDVSDAGATGKLAMRASSAAVLTALLNLATTSNKGLLPPLDGNSNHFLDGTGNYTIPTVSASAADYQAFTVSGTWTKPAWATDNQIVIVEIFGAGGGGGSGAAACGGYGGNFVRVAVRAADLAATVAVMIGAGGSIGAVNNYAGVGGITAFGTVIGTTGGGGGSGTSSVAGVVLPSGGGPNYPVFDILNYGGSPADPATPAPAGTFSRGGGGGGSRNGSTVQAGGTSNGVGYGGSGGTGSTTTAAAGVAPGGGGGGGATGGAGARGEVRVWTLR